MKVCDFFTLFLVSGAFGQHDGMFNHKLPVTKQFNRIRPPKADKRKLRHVVSQILMSLSLLAHTKRQTLDLVVSSQRFRVIFTVLKTIFLNYRVALGLLAYIEIHLVIFKVVVLCGLLFEFAANELLGVAVFAVAIEIWFILAALTAPVLPLI